MSKCTDRNVANLLHGYELGTLTDEERERFEVHLLQCEHCHNLLTGFERESSLLVSSEAAREAVERALLPQVGLRRFAGRIWRRLWPDAPFVFRPAVIYVVILLLIVPAYLGLRGPDALLVTEVGQTVHLSPTRTVSAAFSKTADDNGLLTFEFDGYRPDGVYRVAIEFEDGAVVYENSEFSSFDEREIGGLNLEISEMAPGRYRLTVTDAQSDSAAGGWEYLFIIDE
jgi:hypothetical protein